MRESAIERECRKLAEAEDCWLLKFIPFGFVGFPDRIFIGWGAKVVFLEFKKPKGGVVKKHQQRRIASLRAFGFTAEVVVSVDHFKQITGIGSDRGKI